MAEIVKGWIADEGYQNVPQFEDTDQVILLDFAGAANNEIIWKSGNAQLKKIDNGTISWHNTGSGGGMYGIGAVSHVALILYKYQTDSICLAYYAANNGDVTTIIDKANHDNFSGDFRLYRGTIENAGANYADIVLSTWEDTPTMEDQSDDIIGGELADLMEWSGGDIQSVGDIFSSLGWNDADNPNAQTGLDPYSSAGNSFFTPYVLSPAQFANLGYCMFSSSMWNTISQWFSGPENVLAGILRVLDFPCYPSAGAGANIAVCGQDIYYETAGSGRTYATGNHLGSRYRDHVLGSVTLKETWGTARDYTDTRVQIYLPFVGIKEIDAAQCIGHTLTLLLRIDFWTGDILYLLNADNDNVGGKWYRQAAYIGRWTGNCAAEIPVGRQDNSKALTSLLGGLGAAAGGLAMASFASTPVGALGGLAGMVGGAAAAGGHLGGMLAGGLPRHVNMQGNLTGNTGVIDILYPYLIVQRAVPDYPLKWRSKIGAPRHKTYTGNDLAGYTLFEEIKLENMEGASGEEIAALTAELCSEGIIF